MIGYLAGHGDKGEYDPGTRSPAGWDEADLVRAVAVSALAATPGGVLVTRGTYDKRAAEVKRLLPSAPLIQIHADASPKQVGPDRATLWIWPGNDRSRSLAHHILAHLAEVVPWPIHVIEASATISWHASARACLRIVPQDSVLVEVGFADGVQGRLLLPALAHDIGRALAVGTLKYLEENHG